MNGAATTVHIVEDEPGVLRSLMRVLSGAGHEVRGYNSSEEFLAQCGQDDAGCIVMDVCLPGMTGLDLQEHLNARGCVQPVIFVTGKADVSSSVRAMRAGAMNFLTKPVEAETLIGSVQEALHRGAFEQRRRTRREIVLQRLATLTPREHQVFEAVVSGYLNKQTAAAFGVGEKTIKVHRGRVMHKMQAKTLAQLVRMADGVRESAAEDDWDLGADDTFGLVPPTPIDTHRSWS